MVSYDECCYQSQYCRTSHNARNGCAGAIGDLDDYNRRCDQGCYPYDKGKILTNAPLDHLTFTIVNLCCKGAIFKLLSVRCLLFGHFYYSIPTARYGLFIPGQ